MGFRLRFSQQNQSIEQYSGDHQRGPRSHEFPEASVLKWKSHDRRVVAVVLLVRRLNATGFFRRLRLNANFRKMEVAGTNLGKLERPNPVLPHWESWFIYGKSSPFMAELFRFVNYYGLYPE